MNALVMNADGLSLKEVSYPKRSAKESIIKVRRAGICGTDLAISSKDYHVQLPIILGHEIFGTIEKGSSDQFPLGARVVTEINVSCGQCELCAIGMNTHCKNIQTLGISRDGGFAEYISVPMKNLHLVPDSISDDEAFFVEPLAAAIELTKMAKVEENSTCAVIGLGRLGLLIVQVLGLQNPRLLVGISHNRKEGRKVELARSFGAQEILSSDESFETIKGKTSGIGYDHVVDATGNVGTLDFALEIVRPRGTVHVKSTHGLPVTFDLTKAVVNEVRIQGSRCGPFEKSIELLSKNKVSVKELLTRKFRLEEFQEAFSRARKSETIKVAFEM